MPPLRLESQCDPTPNTGSPGGRLRATRPGEYVLLDTTPLDVFAMDQVTLRWVQVQASVAIDLYDRCVCGLRLTPVSAKAVDAAALLFEAVRPLSPPAEGWIDVRPPYHGLPRQGDCKLNGVT